MQYVAYHSLPFKGRDGVGTGFLLHTVWNVSRFAESPHPPPCLPLEGGGA